MKDSGQTEGSLVIIYLHVIGVLLRVSRFSAMLMARSCNIPCLQIFWWRLQALATALATGLQRSTSSMIQLAMQLITASVLRRN